MLYVAKEKDVLIQLLESDGVKYEMITAAPKTIISKLMGGIKYYKQYKSFIQSFKPDIIVSKASPYAAIAGRINKITTVITPDSEVVKLTNVFVSRLSDYIITPDCFNINFGKKHFRLNGFFEDHYLHPDEFRPNPDVLREFGIDVSSPFFVLRFVSWAANHDIGKKGIDFAKQIRLVNTLNEYGTVYVSSEGPLPEEIQAYAVTTPPHLIHQLLHFAQLYIGDSQTMATEAALLGTPAIRCNSFVGANDMSNFVKLENEYGMLFNFSNIDQAINKAVELAANSRKEEWQVKRTQYYQNKPNINYQFTAIIEEVIK